ncbi:MAG TPA: PqqD family protein [Solirubrobacterales bacterium]
MEEKLDRDAPLRAASANVHSKVFDDEVVILDMKSGTYFSLRASGVDVWKLIEGHASATRITEALGERFDAPPEEIATAVDSLLDELAASALIVADPSLDQSSPSPGREEKAPFTAPQVERFTDMQELLLLDPIHEVDDAGWPHTPMTR